MAFKMNGFSGFKNVSKTKYGEASAAFQKNGGTDPKKIYVSKTYKEGDNVREDDLESKFKRTGSDPKNYPQLSVQDYSTVKVDEKGPYVVKLSE